MATVPNKATGQVDKPFLTPNRFVGALDIPQYAGEIVVLTTTDKAYVAVPPMGLAQASWTADHWAEYGYGIGLN